MARIVKPRIRYFCAVEGESEQSLIKLLQHFADEQSLHIHLDCRPLGGGGYKSMLYEALRYRKRQKEFKDSILLVDTDRDTQKDDGWSLDLLKEKAEIHNFTLCLQNPNLEGSLLCILSNKYHQQLSSRDAHGLLCKVWTNYEKPADAATLKSKFSLDHLLRAARIDPELKKLLMIIGLFPKITT